MKFPKIDSPCPLRMPTLPTAQKNFCTRCERKVHDLSAMTEAERGAFLASCSGKVCVAYALPRAPQAAALRIGLGMLTVMAAVPTVAQQPRPDAISPVLSAPKFPYAESSEVRCDDANEPAEQEYVESIIIVGGVTDSQNVRWVEADDAQPALPAVPVVPADAFLDVEFAEAPERLIE